MARRLGSWWIAVSIAVLGGNGWVPRAEAGDFNYSLSELGPLSLCAHDIPSAGVGQWSAAQIKTACKTATEAESQKTLAAAHAQASMAGLAPTAMVGDLPQVGIPISGNVIVSELAALVQARMEQEVIQSFTEQIAERVCGAPTLAQWVPRFCQLAQVLPSLSASSPWLLIRRALEEDLRALPQHSAAALLSVQAELTSLPGGMSLEDLDGYGLQFDPRTKKLVLRGRLGRAQLQDLAAQAGDAAWRGALKQIEQEARNRGESMLGVTYGLELTGDLVAGRNPLPRLLSFLDPEASGYYCASEDGRCARLREVMRLAANYLVRVLGNLHQRDNLTGGKTGLQMDPEALLVMGVKHGIFDKMSEGSIRRVARLLASLRELTEQIPRAEPGQRATLVLRAVSETFALSRELLDGVANLPTTAPTTVAVVKRWNQRIEAWEHLAQALLTGPRFDQAFLSVLLQVRASEPDLLPPAALEILTFAINLASARDSDSVREVLESTAAQVGAWRSKRRPGVHFSVTALPGLAGGLETTVLGSSVSSPAVYLFAPIGVEMSLLGSRHFSLGFLLSVIDVGQLLSVPLNETSSAEHLERSDVRIEQVFSPGLFVKLGLADTPLVVGAGASLAPALRDVLAGQPVEGAHVVRFIGFVGVDVTLYPF